MNDNFGQIRIDPTTGALTGGVEKFNIPNPNTNDAMLNSVQNELGQSANNIPFELNDMIQKARQEAQ